MNTSTDPVPSQALEPAQPVTEKSTAPPDRLSVDPAHRFYDEAVLARGIGIRFNGAEKTTVEEYCVSEGWIRVAAGRARDRRGNPILLTLKGRVEPYFLDEPPAR
jgi:Protein of unknown function (DUF3297)